MPFFLLCLGFIGAALVASLDTQTVNWWLFAIPLIMGFVGVIWHRRRQAAAFSDKDKVQGNLGTLTASLDNIRQRLQKIVADRDNMRIDEYRQRIDKDLRDDLYQFAEARHSVQAAYGLQAYADVMSAFASGERYVNRVWSASVDGYVDEANEYLQRAAEQFDLADTTFQQLSNR